MFITRADVERARQQYRQPPWSIAWERLLEMERGLAGALPVRVENGRHNWLLEQTRLLAKHLHSLTVLWSVEPSANRHAAIVELIEDLLSWDRWSLEGAYDLSTGEIAVCLGGLLEWMGADLPPGLAHAVRQQLVERVLDPYLAALSNTRGAAWWNCSGSNWSAVCHAGGYYAALTLGKETSSAAAGASAAEALAWAGLEAFVAAQPRDGGSTESVSYWQYGLRYLTYALLAYERKHGRIPELCADPYLDHGARFYLAFVPEGAPIGFGDCSYAPPEALLLKFCERVGDVSGRAHIERLLVRYLRRDTGADKPRFLWNQPREAQALLFCTGIEEPEAPPPDGVTAFPETGWYSLRQNALTVSFRTGDNAGGHAMADQLAINAAVRGTVLLRYLENHPYTLGWFDTASEATRRHYFEAQSLSKNTLVVNGIGQIRCGEVIARPVADGVEADASHLYPAFVSKACRTVRSAGEGVEVIDEIATEGACWHEIRFFTDGEFEEGEGGGLVVAHGGQRLELHISTDIPVRFIFSVLTPSIGVRPPFRMLRITTENAVLASRFMTRLFTDLPVKSKVVRREGQLSPEMSSS